MCRKQFYGLVATKVPACLQPLRRLPSVLFPHTVCDQLRPHRVPHRAQILESQPELYFHLQQQQLIELIRGGNVEGALDFAAECLAPLAVENTAFLEELGEGQRGRGRGPGRGQGGGPGGDTDRWFSQDLLCQQGCPAPER